MEFKQKQQRIVNQILFLLPIFALFFIFRKVIFAGEMFFNGDSILQFYLYFKLAGMQGSLVVPEMLAGFPLYASIGVGWFFPVNIWFAKALGYVDGYNLLTLFNFILAYLFTYLYSRKISLNQITSIIVATIFTFSSHLIIWGSLPVNSNYYYILPAVLWLSEYLRHTPEGHRVLLKQVTVNLLIGVILGMGWLSSHTQFVVYIHVFLAMYFLFLIWQEPMLKNILRKVAYLLICYGTSLLVGWSQISATLSLRDYTNRVGGTSLAENFSSTFLLQDVIHYFLPFWENPIITMGSASIYLGILPIFILIFGLINWKMLRTNKFFIFAAVTFIGSLLLSITYSPLALLLHELPLFDSFRGAQRIMFIGNFGAAMLIGLTLNYLVNNQEKTSIKLNKLLLFLKRVFQFVVLPLIIIVTSVQALFYDKILDLFNNYFLTKVYANTTRLPEEHYLNLINNYLTDTLDQAHIGNWQIISFIIFSILAYYLLKNINKFSSKLVLMFAMILMVFNFSFVYANYYQTVPSKKFLEPSPTAEYINNHNIGLDPVRVFSLFSGMTEYNELSVKCPDSNTEDRLELEKALLTPNLNLQYGLASPDGYENFMTLRLAKLLAYVGSDRSTTGDLLVEEDISIEQRLDKFIARKNILRSMNVGYVVSHFELDDKDFKLLDTQIIGDCQTEVNIYELSNPWPRYFLTNNVVKVSDGSFEEIMSGLQSTDITNRVLLESTDQGIGDTLNQKVVPIVPLIEGDRMLFTVDVAEQSLLFIGNAWLPGWEAMIDGQEVEILRANYAFMAIPVAAGQHNVVLIYTK